jgi:hypothetical protein
MPIDRLLKHSALGPEEVGCLKTAYETALRSLSVADRNDPLCEMVAKKIIAIGRTGVRDPALISARAIREIGGR